MLDQPIVAERVVHLQVIGLFALCLLVPLNQETGAVVLDHPLQGVDIASAPLAWAAGGRKSHKHIFDEGSPI